MVCQKVPVRFGESSAFLLGSRTSASAECRHWSGRVVRWFDFPNARSGREPTLLQLGAKVACLIPIELANECAAGSSLTSTLPLDPEPKEPVQCPNSKISQASVLVVWSRSYQSAGSQGATCFGN